MNLIPANLLNTHIGTSFEIGIQNSIFYFRDFNVHSQPLVNTSEYIDFCKKINDFSYNSILIGGLGLGYLPYWISNNTSCNIIDVIDNNTELITWSNSNNHLGPNVNILDGDIYTYYTTSTYDLIVLDTWWGLESENIDENEPILVDRFKANTNPGGSIYICLTGTVWTKE